MEHAIKTQAAGDIEAVNGGTDTGLIESDWFGTAAEDSVLDGENQPGQDGGLAAEDGVSGDGGQPPDSQAAESFKLKHLGREFEVTREEIIALAQKGTDYDRIRSRADALSGELQKNSGYVGFLKEMSERAGLPVDDFVASGPPHGAFVRNAESVPGTDARLERRDRELAEFVAEYKGVTPESIPSEVWKEVGRGKPLLAAYQGYENRMLRAMIDANLKNSENRARSTGSRATAGAADERGELENDWYRD